MAYPGVIADIRTAVGLGKPQRLPVFACSEEADVRQCASRYDLYNRDAREMARVQIETIERFDWDWAWLQVDDCIEFETLGVQVLGEGDVLPATCGYLPATREALRRLEDHGYQVLGRMQVLLDAIGRVKDHFGDTVCVTGRVAAPFSSVTLAFGIQETMLLTVDDPGFVREALGFFTEFQTRFGLDQLAAGADALWLGDCNASGHLISPSVYREFALEPARACTHAYQARNGLVLAHNSEERLPMIDILADVGFSALNLGPGVDLLAAREVVGQRVCLSGNVDPIAVLARGTPADVERETRRLVECLSIYGGHLMCSGEMVPRDTPAANLLTMVRVAREAYEARR